MNSDEKLSHQKSPYCRAMTKTKAVNYLTVFEFSSHAKNMQSFMLYFICTTP